MKQIVPVPDWDCTVVIKEHEFQIGSEKLEECISEMRNSEPFVWRDSNTEFMLQIYVFWAVSPYRLSAAT